MTLIEQINEDFIKAFKAKEKEKKNFLGLIRGEVQTAQGRGLEPTDENVMTILKKMEKSLKENVDKGDESSKEELEILNPYLPELMSEDQIGILMNGMIAGGANNIGLIMKQFNENYKGQVDNKVVSKIAKELLT